MGSAWGFLTLLLWIFEIVYIFESFLCESDDLTWLETTDVIYFSSFSYFVSQFVRFHFSYPFQQAGEWNCYMLGCRWAGIWVEMFTNVAAVHPLCVQVALAGEKRPLFSALALGNKFGDPKVAEVCLHKHLKIVDQFYAWVHLSFY